jgi:hypothetical protein
MSAWTNRSSCCFEDRSKPTLKRECPTAPWSWLLVAVAFMHEAIGHSDKRNGRKARIDDVLPIMSLTKQLTAAALFRFIDRGQVALTTRIAEVIPEFGKNGKERVIWSPPPAFSPGAMLVPLTIPIS